MTRLNFTLSDALPSLPKSGMPVTIITGFLGSGKTTADMSRRLNLSDLNGDIHFILRRSNQQLARFLDTAQSDKSKLSANDKSMLRNTFIAFNADTDADKTKLIEQLSRLRQFIESLDLYRFED